MDKTQVDSINETKLKRSQFQLIVNNLENNAGWIELLKIFEDNLNSIDDGWQYLNPHNPDDLSKLQDYRITKMAYLSLINALDNVKADLATTDQLLKELEQPEIYQGGYTD